MQIVYSTQGDLGGIELKGPSGNALDSPAFEDEERLRRFLCRDDLKAVIVRGAGRNFSSGADLEALRARREGDPSGFAAELAAGKRLLDVIRYADLPVVAAIRGGCLGAGLEIALACHFRVASVSAMLGFPEAEHGIMPGLGGTLLARSRVPRGAAIELLLTGRTLGGGEAAALGLVDVAAPTAEVLGRAEGFVRAMTEKRTRAQIRNVMIAIHNAERLPRERALAEETRLFLELAAEAAR